MLAKESDFGLTVERERVIRKNIDTSAQYLARDERLLIEQFDLDKGFNTRFWLIVFGHDG